MSSVLTPVDAARVTVATIRDQNQLREATPAWLELLDRGTVGHNVYNDPRMILFSLQEQLDLSPKILLISLDGKLACVAPLYVQPSRFSFEFSVWRLLTLRARVLRIFGESVVMASDIDPALCIKAIGETLRNEPQSIDYLLVYGMKFSDPFWRAAMQDDALARKASWSTNIMQPEKNRQLRVHESLEEYLSTLGSESRRMLRRHSRNFFKDSTSRMERITDPDQIPQLIKWMNCVYRDSWQGKTFGIEKTDEGKYRTFLEQVAAQGWLRSYVLLQGDEPITFKHGYQYRRVLFSDGTAYRQQYSDSSPGVVLTYSILQDIHADRIVDRWDFGFGDLPYKRTFCNEVNDVAIVYFIPRNRWRFIFKTQMILNFIYGRVRAALVRMRIDRFTRKLVKRQK